MNLIEAVVRRPVTVAVGVILVALFGRIAISRMPIQLTPEVQTPTLTIETRWPGASPQEVEREIVQEQEEQLQSVEGLWKMSSESMDSLGRVILEFPVGTDMSQALLLTGTRLKQVREYPEDADEPVITTTNASDRFIAWFILNARTPSEGEFDAFVAEHPALADDVAHCRRAHNAGLMVYRVRELARQHPEAKVLLPPEVDITKLRRYAEDVIETRFERVEGVAASNVVGGREDEMQVIVDPQRLAARQLTISDVRQALRSQNIDTSAGDFWEGKRRVPVRTLGQFRTPEQVADVIVARRDGFPVYVRDVADVQLGFKKPDGLVRRFGSSVIAVNVQRETGANVIDVMEGLRRECALLNEHILRPRGLELAQVYDETEYIYSAVGLVEDNVIEGGVLTFLALMLFLRNLRSTVVVFTSILVSILGMFLVMSILGRSLNVLSLAGIAFAVGMLVDNFIVVMENIYRHRQQGETALAATLRGTQDVWGAVLASTLANLAVFIPVLFVRDEAGQLFRDIALATSAALAISLLVALLVVPTAAFVLMSRGDHGADADTFDRRDGRQPSWRRLKTWFAAKVLAPLDAFGRRFVETVVRINAQLAKSVSARLGVVAVFVFGAGALIWALWPKVEYLPAGNRNLVICIMLPPPGYNLEQLQAMGARIEQELKPYWDADPGSPESEQLPFPIIGDFFYVARGRMLFMGVRADDPLRAGETVALLESLRPKAPGTFLIAKQTSLFENGLTAGRTVDIEITGPDVKKLVGLGGRIIGQSGQVVPGGRAIPKPSLDLSSPEVHVVPRWEQAADMGVTAEDLGYAVNALVDGAYACDYYLDGDKIDLTIVGAERFASHAQDLRALSIATPTGKLVPLDALADVRPSSGPEQINRRERQRAITIEVTPPADVPIERAMDDIRAQIVEPLQNSPEMEGGLYRITLAGTADKLSTTWKSLGWNLGLAVLITYLVMASLFESWLYPLVIMLSVPLGAVGGFLGLQLLNLVLAPQIQPLDVITMLGFIILVGTVVNNPILIVEQALVHIEEDGMPHEQAILESVRTRIRPIFMTAFIGLFGLLPLVISPGAGSELYRGLGSVLLGGLVVSTVFTLILVPTLFGLTLEAKTAVLEWWHARDTRKKMLRTAPPSPHTNGDHRRGDSVPHVEKSA